MNATPLPSTPLPSASLPPALPPAMRPAPFTRAPAPGAPMAIGRILRAYLSEMKYESLRVLRTPGFSIPFLVLPVPIYLFFGVILPGAEIVKNPGIADYLFSGWMVFATMSPALFGVGCALAIERDAGLLKLKRAWPAPTGAYLVAKVAMAMALAAIAMTSLVVTALAAGKISLSAGQLVPMALVIMVGTMPFAAIGLFLAGITVLFGGLAIRRLARKG